MQGVALHRVIRYCRQRIVYCGEIASGEGAMGDQATQPSGDANVIEITEDLVWRATPLRRLVKPRGSVGQRMEIKQPSR
ncbi:hypothetical protein NITHO_6010002 [Nitrolancea hollandica Lb]|uniref:Uncharacterized protein n=1 Tax=Nitrolancea hollandica Lb TaxID=1129897 RepID=I4EMG8_9BACT|nr:hypothetical protein NITHO_6010002 [Nitrolancea hollandica Lb]